jgi:hypothetical protein
MSQKSIEILAGGVVTPPEIDNYEEDDDKRIIQAIYESSTFDILDNMNKLDFRNIYSILKPDIMNRELKFQRRFLDKYLDKMSELYEYEFPKNPIYDTKDKIELMFKFIEFVEYDNLTFLKYVWKYLDGILEVDIRKYVYQNSKVIVEEITNQANLLTTLTENISEFLRTYNKEGLLEWFIDRSERIKYDIYSENLD